MSDVFAGGCGCGAVRYRMTSEPITTNCCHCRDCQRITGSAFAINAMIETDRVEVLSGQPDIRTLKRDDTSDTHAWRCGVCDALLWADHPMFGDAIRFVRVGTLDRAEAVPPDAHYFLRSKHPWVTVPEGVPAYETLPTDGAGVALTGERGERMAKATAHLRGDPSHG